MFRPLTRSHLTRTSAAGLLVVSLAGCEAEAVELVQEISAARGECTAERLRVSDEECVRMMERYAGMGTDLVHTYIGGVKALDQALDRMPPPAFDTAGLGYAISPEFRQGDASGAGSSPRLQPGSSAAYSYSLDPRALSTGSETGGSAALVRTPAAPGWSDWRDPRFRDARYDPRPAPSVRDGRARPGLDARERSLYMERRFADPFGYGANRWGGYRFDPYRSGFLESGPDGYFRGGANGYGYGYYPDDLYYRGYGYGPGNGYGYDDRYGYSAPYGYGTSYGYLPRDAWYGTPGPSGYLPERGSGSAYGYEDARAYRYESDLPYGYGVDRGYPDVRDPRLDGVTPQEDWGYDPVESGASAAGDARDRAAPVPARPAPHRPGILLPPEERLRRPWIDD